MENSLPVDGRISFNVSYLPNDIVGGDFYSIRQLPSGDYAFMLADVMGHGVAAALYTMHLSSLWNSYSHLLANPVAFAESINRELCKIVKDESFATAICGVINPETGTARVTSAAWPPLLIYRSEGETESIELPGWPLGLENSASYEESELQLFAGETVLMFSDGATEIHNADGELLDLDGLQGLLKSMEYPDRPLKIEALQRQLLNYSNAIRLEDDITLLEIRFF
jgi:serine phosphatase RsbU (regulator of sigma subunit)